jgi:hypothetical protein
MKSCIWCLNDKTQVKFDKKAHSVPQKLGGKRICDDVCDICNEDFSKIENVVIHSLNITREIFIKRSWPNHQRKKFRSLYFKVDFDKNKISLKSDYKFKPNFDQDAGRKLKRGLCKIFLEENEIDNKDSKDIKFDNIRRFSLSDIGNIDIIYFRRTSGIILQSKEHTISPSLSNLRMKYLIDDEDYYEFEIFGHCFGIFYKKFDKLKADNSILVKNGIFKDYILIDKFTDIDFMLKIMN